MGYFIEDLIQNTPLGRMIAIWKFLSIVISIGFAVVIAVLVFKLNLIARSFSEVARSVQVSTLPKRKLVKKWEVIEKDMLLGDLAHRKIAVIEADKLFDFILESMGYSGNSMGEKLDQVNRAQFPRLNQIWAAHKVRNRIVHDTDYTLTREDAEKALAVFKGVLIDLGVL